MANAVQQSVASLDARSLDLRRTIIKMFEFSRRGHLGAAFSLVEILRVIYDDVLKFDAKNPEWSLRDRFILSKGHGCLFPPGGSTKPPQQREGRRGAKIARGYSDQRASDWPL